MATSTKVSVKTKKIPKAPKMSASKASWDKFEKKKREIEAHNKRALAEKSRREKIKAK